MNYTILVDDSTRVLIEHAKSERVYSNWQKVFQVIAIVLLFILIIAMGFHLKNHEVIGNIKSNMKSYMSANSNRHSHGHEISEKYPWVVRLNYRFDGKDTFACSGFLISDQHIVTAAHCLKDNNGKPYPLHSIHFGHSWNGYKVGSKKFTSAVHRDFVKAPINDIGIIKLNFPIIFSENIHSINLPFGQPNVPEDFLVALSWVQNFTMKKEIVKSISTKDCEEHIKSYSEKIKRPFSTNFDYNTKIIQHSQWTIPMQICVVYENGADIPRGDSGLPLQKVNNKGQSTVYGILSRGPKQLHDLPGIYVNIYPYIEWIMSNTGVDFNENSEQIH